MALRKNAIVVEEAEQAIRQGRKLLSICVDEVQLPPRLLLQGWDGSRTNAIAEGLPAFVNRLAPCIVAMDACCEAYHLGRIFVARGHEVRLMLPE